MGCNIYSISGNTSIGGGGGGSSCRRRRRSCVVLCLAIGVLSLMNYCGEAAGMFTDDFYVTWGALNNVKLVDDGRVMQLILDNSSASGFASKNTYLFGSIDMQIKLVVGDSAGTVTAYYFSSETSNHDEVDFEFLGNVSGEPYILQTNVFSNGVGGREQRIYLWFDPAADFHTYSVLWNEQHIILSVDGIPIRQFVNNEAAGVPYLNKQAMRIYSSIWDGEEWATRGGLEKIDWGSAPFIASYGGYKLDACAKGGVAVAGSLCPAGKWWNEATYNALDTTQQGQLSWVHRFFLIYDYCTDSSRYPKPPIECTLNN